MSYKKMCVFVDVSDRCAINNPCEQECVDTGVAIHCQCFDGYLLQPNGRSCIGTVIKLWFMCSMPYQTFTIRFPGYLPVSNEG